MCGGEGREEGHIRGNERACMSETPEDKIAENEDSPRIGPSSREDGHPRWQLTLYAMWIAQLLAILGFSFVMPFLPFYVRELGVTNERALRVWAGLLMTGSALMMSTMAPVWGALADRYGRKLMVLRAMFGGAVILTLMGFARSVYQLLGLRMCQGAVTGTVPASVALVSSVTPRARLGYSLGLMQTAVFVGSSIGPFLGGMAADRFGYRVPFGITGALLLTGGLLVLVGARARFVPPRAEARAVGSAWDIFRTPTVAVLLLVYFSMNLSASFVGAIFPLFVEHILNRSQAAASATGLILGATGVASAVSAVAVGRISDRVGHRRVLIFCTAAAGALCIPQFFAASVHQLLVMRILFGLGAGGMIPAMNAMVATVIPRSLFGRAYGLTTTASAMGWGLGPLLGGITASFFGLRLPFLIMAAMLIGMSLVAAGKLKPDA